MIRWCRPQRSGVQNIAEGSQASGTSKKMELKLTNVARASLEELRRDYEDFLRQRNLHVWDRADPRRQALIDRRCSSADEVAAWVRECGRGGNARDDAQSGYPEVAANAVLILLAVSCGLLDRQITALRARLRARRGLHGAALQGSFSLPVHHVHSVHKHCSMRTPESPLPPQPGLSRCVRAIKQEKTPRRVTERAVAALTFPAGLRTFVQCPSRLRGL